jgi:hypothetical protein
MIFSITYISKAKKTMSDLELVALLDKSRNRNNHRGITGMLLYIQSGLLQHKEGRFIQALEGKEADVRELFSKIKKDERHFDVSVLIETTMLSRNFMDWSMGFKSLNSTEYQNMADRFELNKDFLNYDKVNSFNPALDFIKQFYSLNMTFGRNKNINSY